MPILNSVTLASAGTTGNVTGTGQTLQENSGDRRVALVFTISATGSTPTVDFKYQGSYDNSNFVDIAVLPTDSSTTAVTFTKTSLGTYVSFIDLPRRYEQLRVVTANNTNVTFSATAYAME